jgi:hypothetical protein
MRTHTFQHHHRVIMFRVVGTVNQRDTSGLHDLAKLLDRPPSTLQQKSSRFLKKAAQKLFVYAGA